MGTDHETNFNVPSGMSRREALKILGLTQYDSLEELKKQYRALMMMTHPDVAEKQPYPYDASSINQAYEYLIRHEGSAEEYENSGGEGVVRQRTDRMRWNAPVHPGAYAEREIYTELEDADGVRIGEVVLDCGKFVWSEDEEFSLFLKSLYHCSKKIVREHDAENHTLDSREDDMVLLSKLVYLLAQQFVDTKMVLSLFAKEMASGDIYQMDAMLEIDGRTVLKDGDVLYPAAIRNHRLYVKNAKGKELGYISFKDDRLYYGVIPLFERRAARLKMEISGDVRKRLNGKCYRDVNLYIRLNPEDEEHMLESINLKIDKLLERS